MKCKNCGAELAEGVLFCRECGAKVEPVEKKKRFCRECGTEFAEGTKFCPNCGARIDVIPGTEANTSGTMNSLNTSDNDINAKTAPEPNSHQFTSGAAPSSGTYHSPNQASGQNSYRAPSPNSKKSTGDKIKEKAVEFWDGLDIFGKVITIAMAGSIFLLLISLFMHKGFATFFSVLQIAVLIVAELIHLEKIKIDNGKILKYGAIALAALLAFLNIASYSWGKKSDYGNVLNQENNPPAQNNVNSTATDSVNISIENGTEYAYMSDEWNVYIASAVSGTVVKVSNWDKTLSSDEKLEYSCDIGTYKITDQANGFSWIDDEHTAFYFNLQDKNNGEGKLKSTRSVPFTINTNNSDKNKGTNYDDNIACYSFQNDDWHMYRAIQMSEHLMKVECWSRSSSDDKFLYGYDVCLINIGDSSTDFEWGDDKHQAFTITMQDENNNYYWKKQEFVSFTIENPNSQYQSVKSYLDSLNPSTAPTTETEEANTANDTFDARDNKDGFDSKTNGIYSLASYTVEIPNYWQSEKKIDDGIQWYAETGGKVAMLQIAASKETDDDYAVTFDGLMDDNDNMIASIESTAFSEVTDYEVIDTGVVKGILYKGKLSSEGLDGTGEWFSFPSEEDRYWCTLVCAQTNNTEYKYEEDFRKIINSIKKAESKETSAEESKETTAPTAATEQPEETTEEKTTEEKKTGMPVMAGTTVDAVVKKAKEYGLSEPFSDEDFGHGTKYKTLSDSSGGLMLDIIYSTETKEILCGTIVTNKLASDSSQKKFIKGMAGVMCPSENSKEVSDWVSKNVGGEASTTIGSFEYQVSLGPVNNALYYAGYTNWEDWDLSQH